MHVALREIQASVNSRERIDGPSQGKKPEGCSEREGLGWDWQKDQADRRTKGAWNPNGTQLLPRHHALPVHNLPFGAGPQTGTAPVVPWPRLQGTHRVQDSQSGPSWIK